MIGVATNKDEYVPVIIPIINVKEKGFSTLPPKINNIATTKRVVNEVITVLLSVMFNDFSAISFLLL